MVGMVQYDALMNDHTTLSDEDRLSMAQQILNDIETTVAGLASTPSPMGLYPSIFDSI